MESLPEQRRHQFELMSESGEEDAESLDPLRLDRALGRRIDAMEAELAELRGVRLRLQRQLPTVRTERGGPLARSNK